jgi:hypothetical protein
MKLSVEISEAQYNNTRVGWVNEPDGRGTMSTLVSCLSSLFLSSWAVMHLNIPAKTESKTRRLATYFYWCIYGIFGPELVIWTAWRQLLSAWALRNELRKEKVCAFKCIRNSSNSVVGCRKPMYDCIWVLHPDGRLCHRHRQGVRSWKSEVH